MTRRTTLLTAILALAVASSAEAGSVTLPADNQWHEFEVDSLISNSGGLEWIDLAGDALTFTFNLADFTRLEVVDGGFGGDIFQVLDNALSLGLTSNATDTYPASLGLDFDGALSDPSWSKREFILPPGPHSITGVLDRSALDDQSVAIDATVGAVRLSVVPSPETWQLLLIGGMALRVASRRRLS